MYQKIDKMIKDLEIRGRTPNTIKNMVWSIKNFSKFYNQPPELLGEQDIINYLDYCINVKKLCRGTVNSINSALKFFYVVTLERSWSDLRIPKIRYDKKLPSYLTKKEVKVLLDNITYLKHKAILSTIDTAVSLKKGNFNTPSVYPFFQRKNGGFDDFKTAVRLLYSVLTHSYAVAKTAVFLFTVGGVINSIE